MNITCQIAGYFEWEPLAPGITPTPRDIQQHKVKQDVAGRWLVRVHLKDERSFSCSVPETEIQDQYIYDELNGADRDRSVIVRSYLDAHVVKNHFKAKDVIDVDVQDDGPLVDHFKRRLEALVGDDKQPVFSGGAVGALVKRYADDDTDVEATLERHFNVAPVKE